MAELFTQFYNYIKIVKIVKKSRDSWNSLETFWNKSKPRFDTNQVALEAPV